MNITNHAYILWIDSKPSKISSVKKCLAVHSNEANRQGLATEVTHHATSQEAYDILLSGVSFDEYMNEKEPNPNRFIKSSFTLSLLWVAKFYRAMANQRTTDTNNRFVVSLGSKLGIDFDETDRYQHASLYLHHSSKRCENLLAFILTGISSAYHASHFGFKSTARFINL